MTRFQSKSTLFCSLLLFALIGNLQTVLASNGTSEDDKPSVPKPAATGNGADATRILDQVIDQNQQLIKQNQEIVRQNEQLEKQNQQLMDQINALRGSSTMSANAAPQVGETTSAAQTTVSGQVTQASGPLRANADDTTEFAEASGGNSAIFGEFNPGRGFTVGRGEHGELNLSGYMVARYLNQLPGTQSAVDHLGRPIAVDPRNDFQFHRVMLFAQGWLFSPKFLYSTFVWKSKIPTRSRWAVPCTTTSGNSCP